MARGVAGEMSNGKLPVIVPRGDQLTFEQIFHDGSVILVVTDGDCVDQHKHGLGHLVQAIFK